MRALRQWNFCSDYKSDRLYHKQSLVYNVICFSGLEFNQLYSYVIAFNYTKYTLPPGTFLNDFATDQGVPNFPKIVSVKQQARHVIRVTWASRKHQNAKISGNLPPCSFLIGHGSWCQGQFLFALRQNA